MDSSQVYHGRSYGWMYVCANFPTCDSYIGCHPGTKKPLGRIANKELRQAKVAAHAVFDRLWKAKMRRDGFSKRRARYAGYRWLAEQLGISMDDCHIGMFDVATCRRVVELCSRYIRK